MQSTAVADGSPFPSCAAMSNHNAQPGEMLFILPFMLLPTKRHLSGHLECVTGAWAEELQPPHPFRYPQLGLKDMVRAPLNVLLSVDH